MEFSKVKPKLLISPGVWIKIGFWFTMGSVLAYLTLITLKVAAIAAYIYLR